MEPIEVTVDEDGKVTVIIDLKNGKRGEFGCGFHSGLWHGFVMTLIRPMVRMRGGFRVHKIISD